jgi:hypothetical protein
MTNGERIFVNAENVFDFVRLPMTQFARNLAHLEGRFLVVESQRPSTLSCAGVEIDPRREESTIGADPKGRVVPVKLSNSGDTPKLFVDEVEQRIERRCTRELLLDREQRRRRFANRLPANAGLVTEAALFLIDGARGRFDRSPNEGWL